MARAESSWAVRATFCEAGFGECAYIMSVVIAFENYRKRRMSPPLVLVDMFQSELELVAPGISPRTIPALANCYWLLKCARSRNWPVAFVRPAPSLDPDEAQPSQWIEGFGPQPEDMIFDRCGTSCYDSMDFAEMIDEIGGIFVLAGFGSESTGLFTLIDASRRNHCAGLVCDASASRPLTGFNAADSHRAVVAIADRYGSIVTAEHWAAVASTTRTISEATYVNSGP